MPSLDQTAAFLQLTAQRQQYSLTICNLVRNGVGIALVNPFSLDGLDLSGMALVPFRPRAKFRSLTVLPPNASRSRLTDAFLKMAISERERQAALWAGPISRRSKMD